MASRKEQKERLKAERLAREHAAAAEARRKRLIGRGVGGVLVVAAAAAIVVVVAAGGGGGGGSGQESNFPTGGSVPAQRIDNLPAAAKAAGCQSKDYPDYGSQHVTEPVTYKTNPPTSGPHNPTPAHDGAYTEAPASENLLHAMEHGRVIYWFKPNASVKEEADLKTFFDEDSERVILTPNETGMPFAVAATGWTHLLGCPRTSPKVFDALRAFKSRYRDKGPEYVPQPE